MFALCAEAFVLRAQEGTLTFALCAEAVAPAIPTVR